MRLFELFQTNYDYTRLDDTHYMFDTDQELRYLVNFEQVTFIFGVEVYKIPWVAFGLVSDQGDVTDDIQHTGDAFTVFSTVGKIIQDYLHEHPTDQLGFGAKLSEPSRVKLYKTFIRHLPKFLPGWESELSSDQIDPNLRVWVIKKNNS